MGVSKQDEALIRAAKLAGKCIDCEFAKALNGWTGYQRDCPKCQERKAENKK